MLIRLREPKLHLLGADLFAIRDDLLECTRLIGSFIIHEETWR